MKETTRQKKFSRMIQKEITPVIREALIEMPGTLASVPYVRVSPDLMVVRIYITAFPDEKANLVVELLNEKNWHLRKALAERIRNEVRKMPEITFYVDDTVAYSQKMEDIFAKIHEEEEKNKKLNPEKDNSAE